MSPIAPTASITGSATVRRRTSVCIPVTTSDGEEPWGTRRGSQTRSREWCEMVNSRAKGARGERELANILKKYGYDARRGQQFSGLYGDADVIGLPGIHIEAKRVERLNLYDAMEQSVRDARDEEVPTVFHRKDRQDWLVTMRLEDWMKLYGRNLEDNPELPDTSSKQHGTSEKQEDSKTS